MSLVYEERSQIRLPVEEFRRVFRSGTSPYVTLIGEFIDDSWLFDLRQGLSQFGPLSIGSIRTQEVSSRLVHFCEDKAIELAVEWVTRACQKHDLRAKVVDVRRDTEFHLVYIHVQILPGGGDPPLQELSISELAERVRRVALDESE